jgi:hypothetical protein
MLDRYVRPRSTGRVGPSGRSVRAAVPVAATTAALPDDRFGCSIRMIGSCGSAPFVEIAGKAALFDTQLRST